MRKNTEQRLSALEARNIRVDSDKAWETSLFRRVSVAGLTYVIVLAWLVMTDHGRPFIDAAVPPAGYLLSTLVLSNAKTLWQQQQKA